MIMNSQMHRLIQRDDSPISSHQLPPDAAQIVNAGWTVGPHGALLLKALLGAVVDSGPDRNMGNQVNIGEYEYHANDVYLSLTDLRVDMELYLRSAAVRGLVFAKEMLREAPGLPHADSLCAIVSISVDIGNEDFLLQGATVHFTTRRGGYPDWIDDLEGFELEAIAVLQMVDLVTT